MLSERERQLLKLLAEGKTNSAIAQTLHISLPRAIADRKRIMARLNLRTIQDLANYARENGILKP